jgi:VRR-NUC domain
MKMTEEQVREHQQKNNLPCALESIQSAQAQAVATALASPAQERWQSGEERKLNELVCIDLRRRGAYVLVSRTDQKPTIRRGHPDLTVLYNGKACCIELKAKGGRLSEHQRECIDELVTAGVPTLTCYSFDGAITFAVHILSLPNQ